jgi:hypothetical protein
MVAKAIQGVGHLPEALQRGLGVPGHLPDEVDNGEAPGVHIPLGVERLDPFRGAAHDLGKAMRGKAEPGRHRERRQHPVRVACTLIRSGVAPLVGFRETGSRSPRSLIDPAVAGPSPSRDTTPLSKLTGQEVTAIVYDPQAAHGCGRPMTDPRTQEVPDYLLLLATLGGLAVFGASGFVIGPVIAAFFLVVWEMFAQEHAERTVIHGDRPTAEISGESSAA